MNYDYLIFPMEVVALQQREYDYRPSFSHHGVNAIDCSGKDSGIEKCYAPCTMKILNIHSGSAHTIFFGSCDEKGNAKKVRLADGSLQVVTIAMTHKDSVSGFKVGQIFKAGEECYSEGTYADGHKGGCSGNHVHIEIAKGWVKSKAWYKYNGKKFYKFSDSVSLMPTRCFFLLKDFNRIRPGINSFDTSYGMDLPWVWVDKREGKKDNEMKLKIRTVKGYQRIRKELKFKGKSIDADIIGRIPKGNDEAIILEFIDGLQPDGYQWVKVLWHDIEGYCQWDSTYFEVYEY